MRKMFVVAATLVITFAGLSSLQAGSRPQQTNRTYSTSYRNNNSYRYRYYRGGFFDRLLEMERRKNEMLFGSFRRK